MRTPSRSLAAAISLALAAPAFAGAPPPPLACAAKPAGAPSDRGDPRFRTAAQRGLNFMAIGARAWTQQNPTCYGCHVHSTTLEGLTIGRHNGYDVSPKDMDLMMKAMLNQTQGVHTTTFTTARAFGGVAFARYDQFIDGKRTDDLLRIGRRLTESQKSDGSVGVDDTRFPVESGGMQATFQAMQTWRQAYARTADTVWLQPLRKAEVYLQKASRDLSRDPHQLQDVNYALMGLTAAGVAPSEAASLHVQRQLLSVQNPDGGWGFVKGASDAFATGQTVYALRNAGMTEADPSIARAMTWLVEHQHKDGGWGGAVSTSNGSQFGEAMWAVLGLVSVDVTSIAVRGISDGQHVEPAMKLELEARDNQAAGGIASVEVRLDDLPLHAECGGKLSFTWNTSALKDGKHVIEAIATNLTGKQSRRRFEVYSGDTFLTDVGARFNPSAQKTEISLRDIAPEARKGKVRLEVFAVDAKGAPIETKKIFTADRPTQTGALNFEWAGKDDAGKAQPRGRYVARVSFVSPEGDAVQKEQVLFSHDSEENQRAQFGEIQGQLSMKSGAGSTNTVVELVDDEGRVVQATRSTDQGNYRFKNVNAGQFKVRVRKDGFAAREMQVESKPAAAPAQASMTME